EKSGLALLVSDAAIDDQVDAFNDRLGEPGGGALALLVAVVERRVGAFAVGDELVDPDRGVDRASARQAELLIVAGYREEGLQVGRGVVDAADAVALVERVVVAIAIRLDGVAVKRCRPWAVIGRGGDVGQTRVERADAGLAADRDRRA